MKKTHISIKARMEKLKVDCIMERIAEVIEDAAPEPGEVPLADDRLMVKIRMAISVALYEMEN